MCAHCIVHTAQLPLVRACAICIDSTLPINIDNYCIDLFRQRRILGCFFHLRFVFFLLASYAVYCGSAGWRRQCTWSMCIDLLLNFQANSSTNWNQFTCSLFDFSPFRLFRCVAFQQRTYEEYFSFHCVIFCMLHTLNVRIFYSTFLALFIFNFIPKEIIVKSAIRWKCSFFFVLFSSFFLLGFPFRFYVLIFHRRIALYLSFICRCFCFHSPDSIAIGIASVEINSFLLLYFPTFCLHFFCLTLSPIMLTKSTFITCILFWHYQCLQQTAELHKIKWNQKSNTIQRHQTKELINLSIKAKILMVLQW